MSLKLTSDLGTVLQPAPVVYGPFKNVLFIFQCFAATEVIILVFKYHHTRANLERNNGIFLKQRKAQMDGVKYFQL